MPAISDQQRYRQTESRNRPRKKRSTRKAKKPKPNYLLNLKAGARIRRPALSRTNPADVSNRQHLLISRQRRLQDVSKHRVGDRQAIGFGRRDLGSVEIPRAVVTSQECVQPTRCTFDLGVRLGPTRRTENDSGLLLSSASSVPTHCPPIVSRPVHPL